MRQDLPVNTVPVISQHDAQRAIAVMAAQIERRGQAAVLAVADDHGELIALLRMDGCPYNSITIATNKAFTAARARTPSADVGRRVRDEQDGHDIAYYGDPRFIGWGGGLPVFVDGKCAGAVAVSGLPEADDVEIAALGVAAVLNA